MFLLPQRLRGIIMSIIVRVKHGTADNIDAVSLLGIPRQQGGMKVAPYHWNEKEDGAVSKQKGAMLSREIHQHHNSKLSIWHMLNSTLFQPFPEPVHHYELWSHSIVNLFFKSWTETSQVMHTYS